MDGNTVGEFLAGWRELDDVNKDKLLASLKDDPMLQPRVTFPDKIETVDEDPIGTPVPKIFVDIQLCPYISYCFYYPTIHWSLDKTPDTDNYWVGLYNKNEKDDKKYLAYQWIYKAAKGSYKVSKLKTTAYILGSSRHEEFEVRIFKDEYQRLDAETNILRGVVNQLPTDTLTKVEKLLSRKDTPEFDKDLLTGLLDTSSTTRSFSLRDIDVNETWNEFTPNRKKLIYPILEQDSLPDAIKKPDDRGTDRPEPNVYFAERSKLEVDDHSNVRPMVHLPKYLELMDDGHEKAPSKIVLTITLNHSSTHINSEVDVHDEVLCEGAWLGLYHNHGSSHYDPEEYIDWHHVDKGQKGSHKLSDIKDQTSGPLNNTYVGPIFNKNNKQIGIAATAIEAVISVGPPLPPAVFKPGFDKDEALRYAKLSCLAYEEYSVVQQQLPSYGLTADMLIHDASTDTHGFIASNHNSVVIAFRGTASITNWVTNSRIAKKPIIEGQPYFVHHGFLKAFRNVYGSIEAQIMPFIGKKEIYTTGHSLGGALASLLAFYVSYQYENAKPIHNAFGCPPVGDINFSEYFKDKHSNIITIQNDVVATGLLIRTRPVHGFFQPHQVMFLPETGSHGIRDYIKQLENLS